MLGDVAEERRLRPDQVAIAHHYDLRVRRIEIRARSLEHVLCGQCADPLSIRFQIVLRQSFEIDVRELPRETIFAVAKPKEKTPLR